MPCSEALDQLPSEFTTLQQPPASLYYRGDLSLLSKRKVAIVGSRKAYPYSRHLTQQLALELCKRGVSVVSGGAMGIDALAHEGAFPNTIAILANGLDIAYPKVNAKLLDRISKEGLLLSEYEDGVKAKNYSFVHRNRLVVALSEVLIVAQADLDSGSMRSVEFALEMGKEIYVLPHRLGESEGTMKLVEDNKAELITNIPGFVDRFGGLEEEKDAFLIFCQKIPSYDEALSFDAQKLFEYELLGKIKIENSKVIPI